MKKDFELVIDYTYVDAAMDYYSTLITAMKQPHFPKKSFQFWTFLSEDRWM